MREKKTTKQKMRDRAERIGKDLDMHQRPSVEDLAWAVVMAAQRNDLVFIECLRGDDPEAAKLRHAIVDLQDVLRK